MVTSLQNPSCPDHLCSTLTISSCTLQETICTAGELFLAAHKGFQRQAILPAKAKEEGMSVGELLFDKLPGADSSVDEGSAWQVQNPVTVLISVEVFLDDISVMNT